MDAELIGKLQNLYSITHIPLSLLDGSGRILATFPAMSFAVVDMGTTQMVLEDFRLQRRDSAHPLISYMEPGFFLGIMELLPELYLLIGLVSPLPRARNDTLRMIVSVAAPEHLQELCNLMLQTPLVSLDHLRDLMGLLSQLLMDAPIQKEHILFMNIFTQERETLQPELQLFQQREHIFQHESIDFETAICNAIARGSPSQLAHSLYAPRKGQVGRMSGDDLRQEKYSFVVIAALASRAAIRGGLPAELSFSLSDLYCQRADVLTDAAKIRELCGKMLTDYCERVRQKKEQPTASPVISRCLEYISVHLHEPISLSDLSKVCGLCTRSLSLKFKEEMGTRIGDYIHEEKLKEAEYLLRHTDYTLSQISTYLGYSSQSYFTRIFREFTGMTPQQYRDRSF